MGELCYYVISIETLTQINNKWVCNFDRVGDLPWRFGQEKEREKTEITRDLVFVEKQNCIKQPSRLFKGSYMPQSIENITRHLDKLEFTDTPDYDYLDQQM